MKHRLDLAEKLGRPLAVGAKIAPGRLMMASLSELGNIAFRELVSQYGGYGLLFGEMWNARAVPTENRYRSTYFRWRDEERQQLVPQILGNDPTSMAAAAARLESEGFFGVDINLSCSAKRVCSRKIGAALLKEPRAAILLIKAVRRAISVPLFVKFRIGWQDDLDNAVDLAKAFESEGADALTFHPRVAPDRRTRPPKWDYIRSIAKAVSIPVLGNGNVFTAEDCRRMLDQTGCAGVSVGRAALAKPWLFADWTGGGSMDPGRYCGCAIRLIDLLELHFEPHIALKRFKKFSFYFSANFRYGHSLHRRVITTTNLLDARGAIADFFAVPPEIGQSLNMNFFS